MPPGWGHGVGRTPRRRRVAAPRQEPCDSPWTSAGARTCRRSRGRSPSSAPAGDPRSVAPGYAGLDTVRCSEPAVFGGVNAAPTTGERRAASWSRPHPGAARGQGRPERQARVASNRRIRPEVPDRGLQLGREVEGRAGAPAPRLEPAEGPQDAHGEEPNPGRAVRGGVSGASSGVPASQLAISRRARARARDRTPHRRHPPAPVVGHRP